VSKTDQPDDLISTTEPDDAPTPAAEAGDGARTRTRTRTRSAPTSSAPTRAARASAKPAKSDVPQGDGKEQAGDNAGGQDTGAEEGDDARPDDDGAQVEPSGSDDDSDEVGGAKRRRRRGSRGGRGRRKSSSEAAGGPSAESDDEYDDQNDDQSDAESDDQSDDQRDQGGEEGGDRDDATSARHERGPGRSRGGRRTTAKATRDADEPDESAEDTATREAIARGGTRMAAKRQRRPSGGVGGGHQGPRGVSEEDRRAILEGPPRTMLVTARKDRTQIAVLEDRRVMEHHVTHVDDVTYVGNIYMARVQNVLPGMEAAFLDIGKGRNGVLYAGEVLYDEQDLDESAPPRIEDTLKNGQKVLVQVTKDPMGTKGPRLTQHLSLAGRYMVLAPNSDLFGISRKLTDKERDRLRRIVKTTKPEHHGIIVRTAAEHATEEQLTADLERLLAKWEKVEEAVKDAKVLSAVYEEPKLVVKVIRDNFGPEFERCIVDAKELYDEVRSYLEEVAPELLDKVELYEPRVDGDEIPSSLFEAYNVNEQLRKAMDRKVWLPSGGYLIIETTEAMKVIDVNTGKFTGGKDASLEEVVLKTNLEAADEIVRQLRLRDLGGMIIIDFIDMLLKANQDQVVRRLKRELLRDRTKTRVSEVSRLGLVQMTRKNVSHGLVESFSHRCETCSGAGRILDDLD